MATCKSFQEKREEVQLLMHFLGLSKANCLLCDGGKDVVKASSSCGPRGCLCGSLVKCWSGVWILSDNGCYFNPSRLPPPRSVTPLRRSISHPQFLFPVFQEMEPLRGAKKNERKLSSHFIITQKGDDPQFSLYQAGNSCAEKSWELLLSWVFSPCSGWGSLLFPAILQRHHPETMQISSSGNDDEVQKYTLPAGLLPLVKGCLSDQPKKLLSPAMFKECRFRDWNSQVTILCFPRGSCLVCSFLKFK